MFRLSKRDSKTTLKEHYRRKDRTYLIIDAFLYFFVCLLTMYVLQYLLVIDFASSCILSAVIALITSLYIEYLIKEER